MTKYQVDSLEISRLNSALNRAGNAEEMIAVLGGILGGLEGDAIVAKQSAGNPRLSDQTQLYTEIVAEKIYHLREYLQERIKG